MTIERIIEEWQDRPFEWGVTDCCQFVSACVEELTGEDFVSLVLYENHDEAIEQIDAAGGLDLLVSSVLGDPEEREPRDNDVVIVTCNGEQILGFVWNGVVILRTEQGLVDWPIDSVELVWAPL